MHLNIPPYDEPYVQTWIRNLKWGLIGTFAPELVVLAAWRQYNSAKALHTEMRRHLGIENVTPPRADKVENESGVNQITYLVRQYL
jgi:hypothetical protein